VTSPPGPGPFAALGLPPRPDLTDDDVRSAWRRLATATHPDRADGGDPARFAAAAAAYTVLRTRSGRGEALADLASPSPAPGQAPRRRPTPPVPPPQPGLHHPAAGRARRLSRACPSAGRTGTGPTGTGRARLLARIRRGRPARLALRVLIAAAVCAVAVTVAGAQPATPALITGAVTWLLLTARYDLAPPR
jgi:DnaJ domain